MAGFLSIPRAQFFDDQGNILAGGHLYTYEVGTTTPKVTYPTIADALAKTNANATDIVLDSAGRTQIVLAGPTKLILKDSLLNLIWTVDNVSSDNSVIDTSGNILIKYTTGDTSAVNYLEFVNSATGDDIEFKAEGSDTDVGIKITPKGAGIVTVTNLTAPDATLANATLADATLSSPTIDSATITNTTIVPTTPLSVTATDSVAGELRLPETTGNGTNYVGFVAPASIATNLVFKMPGVDGTSGQMLQTDGAATLSWTTLTQAIATAADQETGTATVRAVTPSVQQRHPSACKSFIMADAAGNISISYNITSITDTGTGVLTVTIATDHSSANYVIAPGVNFSGSRMVQITTQTAGTFVMSVTNSATSAADPTYYYGATFGDQ